MIYPKDYINKIICGNCIEVMKDFPDNCIDTIITDPPYGLSFMGKKWDYQVPSIEIWQECLRVLKPGGTALIFAGSRTQHRMAVNVEDAGFILKDCIMWIYGSGFPKASDISKQLDKKKGKLKTQGKGFVTAGNDGRKSGFKQTLKYRSDYGYQYEPKDKEATLWNGWKSHGLKPAYEPILVAVKPNEGNYANNALKWNVAGLNIDGGRIGTTEEIGRDNTGIKGSILNPSDGWNKNSMVGLDTRGNQKGRYPANVILDEEAGRLLDEQSKPQMHGAGHKRNEELIPTKQNIPFKGEMGTNYKRFGDSGGASRFFYCAKASKAERNRGCEELYWLNSKRTIKEIWEKLDKENEENKDNKNFKRHNVARGNIHPTVKNLSLMKYICTLTATPTGGIVLDPFCGSGTTLMACKEIKSDYIGIDKEQEDCKIERRSVREELELLV